ncbi:MAG: copper resistance CopC family protein [Methylocystis sp.]
MKLLHIIVCSAMILATISSDVQAHGYLVSSFPSAKVHLKTPPHKIKLRFSLRADAHYSTIDLESEDGSVLATKNQPKASREMAMDAPVLTPGRYRLRYRILSPDGDLVRGKIVFFVDE